jgi:EmrB/QacA subfamily drug resistance transporter
MTLEYVDAAAPAARSQQADIPTALSRSERRSSLVLAAACLGQLLVVLDTSVVNVALPHIGSSLGFSASSLSWVVSAYTLAFAGLLLFGGRLADLLGHRRTMLSALTAFGIASVLGGLAQGAGQLVAARAAQGATAAVLSPVTLTVILATFPDGRRRNRAVATWGMVATVGGALGVLLSGVLTEYLDWRWVMFVNIPFVGIAGAFALVAVRDSQVRTPARLDTLGAMLATASMALLSYAFVHAGDHAWSDVVTVSTLGAAIATGAGFVVRELRAEAPLIRLSILGSRSVSVATALIAFVGMATITGFYFTSLFLQNVLRYDPVSTGLAFLPFCACMAAATMASSRLVERFGARLVIGTGMLVAALGMLLFSQLSVGSGYGAFLLGSIPTSLGLGVSIAPTLSLGTARALPREAGMISGVLNTSRQAGGSLALAVLVSVASRVDTGGVEGLAHGYRVAFVSVAALLLVAAAVAAVGVTRRTA